MDKFAGGTRESYGSAYHPCGLAFCDYALPTVMTATLGLGTRVGPLASPMSSRVCGDET